MIKIRLKYNHQVTELVTRVADIPGDPMWAAFALKGMRDGVWTFFSQNHWEEVP